jgi:hypothetical protein
MLNIDHQAEMWAVLCAPPEQFNELIELFDNMEFKKKFKRTSFAWNTIDPDEVVRKFRIACVEYAMVMARKVQPTPTPDYWQTVEDSCRQVIDALNGNGDLVAARAAADAADAAAAYAADAAAAYAAAAYAADAAAYAAADAAAAARAAYAAAAYAADAAAAARAAAEADLSEIFINIILSEYENKD